MVSILDSCMFSLFISTYHKKFHNFSQVAYSAFSHELLLNIEYLPNYFYFVSFADLKQREDW